MNYTDGYLIEYAHKIPLNSNGVTASHLAWGKRYCKGKIGWHFDDKSKAVISFELERDAGFWCLRWMDEYNKRNT